MIIEEYRYISFMLHFCRSKLYTESFLIKDKVKISLLEFKDLFPSKIKEDVRYNFVMSV